MINPLYERSLLPINLQHDYMCLENKSFFIITPMGYLIV